MTKEQLLLLDMMKLALKNQKLYELPSEPVNWTDVWNEACDQTVRILFCDVLSPVQEQLTQIFPQMEDCMLQAMSLLYQNAQMEAAQAELVTVLEQISCPYVILKGQVAASYYPAPSLRQLGDVDFLVPEDRTQTIADAMISRGYAHSWEPGDYHQVLTKSSVQMEMHTEVAGMPDRDGRTVIEEFMRSIYEQKQTIRADAADFQAPGEAHHALIQILHMQHHVEEYGLGLRQVIDWACFVDRTLDHPFWPSFLELLKQVGLHRFTAVMTKMSAMYLGSTCPDWAAYVEEDLCTDMMHDIMSGGNFGRKDKNRIRSASMLPDWESEKSEGKVKRMFGALRTNILSKHPEMEHQPVRMAGHMLYRMGRFAVLYIQGKRPNLIKAASIAEDRKSIYERLRMYETEDE